MADKGKNCSLWLNFFRDAGITGGFETKYALVFDENRIKMNMLLDLNKECLRDMGIKAMGDIIAILKHAKIVHDESMELAFESSKPTQSQPSSTNVRHEEETTSIIPTSQSNPATTMAAASVLKITSSSNPVPAKPSEDTPTPTSTHVFRIPAIPKLRDKKVTIVNSTKKVSSTLGSSSNVNSPIALASRKRVISLRSDPVPRSLPEEVPVQKKIRVLPEHEGKYKIKMSPRAVSRAILPNRLGPSLMDSMTERKSGIFNRLGESKVTSTSTTEPSLSRSPILFNDDNQDLESSISKPSVFARLGGRPSITITTSSTSTPLASNSRLVTRTLSSAISNVEYDPPNDRVDKNRKQSISVNNTKPTSSSSECLPRLTRVYRNPTPNNPRDESPLRRTVGNTSRMRSEISTISAGKVSSIKSRLDTQKSYNSTMSESASKKISTVKRTIEPPGDTRTQLDRLQIGSSVTKPKLSPIKTTFTRVVTRKTHDKDGLDFFDLPELEDPMIPYYDLSND